MQNVTALTDPNANKLALAQIAMNATVGKWRTEAMRSHSSPRLLYIVKGQGRITVAGLTSGYGPNNLIYIPAHTMYGYEVGPTVFGQMLSIPVAMASDWPDEPTHIRLRDVIAQKEAAAFFDNLERELKSGREGHNRAALHHLGILSVFFGRQVSASPADPGKDRAHSTSARLVAAFADLIERDFHSDKGVAEYAAELGVTPTHLTRCCKATCGKSALALVNDRVLYEARILLRTTKTPVQDISRQLGFNSAAYFTRSFQAATGTTPSQFRRKGPLPAFI